MMSRYRTYALAAFGAMLLLGLSLSATFGAKPTGADGDSNRGQQVSDFVHSLFNSDEDSSDEDAAKDEDADADEEADEEEADEEEADEDAQGQPDNHGACVREVAMDPEAVGPPNDNHGGAVNVAAREDCWETEDGEEGASVESDTFLTGHGKSGEHRGNHGHHHAD